MGLLSPESVSGLLGSFAPLPDYAGQAQQAVNAIQPDPPQHHGFNFGNAALAFFGGPGVLNSMEARKARALEQQKLNAALQLQAQAQARQQSAIDAINADTSMTPAHKAYAIANLDEFTKRVLEQDGTFNQSPDSQLAVGQGDGTFKTFAGPQSYRENDGIIYRGSTPVAESPYPKVFQGPNGGFVQQPRIGIQGLQGGQAAPQTNAVGSPAGSAPVHSVSGPSPNSISFLRQHPETAAHFEQRYGLPPGSAQQYLNGSGGAAPSNGPVSFP